ncbi:MAG TPA: DNA double-strand break repair nuclease NurA [Thermodesulfobacteriota bacterium]|nr:DNA double-strand break repair nuclease NurA [Thermodesulfobacteriota bacterium]
MIRERKDFAGELTDKIRLAKEELRLKSEDWEGLSRKVEESRTSWLVAGISSPPASASPLPERPRSYTAVSSDGSQIFPDRHEALPCYLINISSITLTYGDEARAELSSGPSLFYRDEDRFTTWGGKKVPADSDVISLKRTLMEFERILQLVKSNEADGNTIALSDGTLILWRLEASPPDFRDGIMVPFLRILEEFRALRIPVAGYISYPGSTDVINALRVGLCPEKVSFCNQCPYTELPELPCSPIEGLTDRFLFSTVLDTGEASAVFKSSSKILEMYGEHHIYFFYINIGEEIARVEVPKWVAEDGRLLALVHTLIFDQAKKGKGYPVSIAEAHEQAVVKAKDRDFFFSLIREAMVKSDFAVTVSRKGLSKRIPGV